MTNPDGMMLVPAHLLEEAKRHVAEHRRINKSSSRQDAGVPSSSLYECEHSHRAGRVSSPPRG
jgi:hypothetical protein